MPDEDPKIFVDEDWKSKVQKERESAPESEAKPDEPEGQEQAPQELPEPSMTAIVNNMAAQAMMALGGMPGGQQGEVYVDLHQGKFCIESLAVLREKTKGNLDEEEGKYLDEVLSQLSQAFKMLLKELDAQTLHEAGISADDLKLQ